MDCTTPGFPVHHQLPEPTQAHVHRVSDAIQPSDPLSSSSPPTFSLSQHQGLSQWIGSSHQVARVWSFSFGVSPFNEYSGQISFRMDWLDLLAVQGTLKSPFQHHSSKASILRRSAFFIVQLSATPLDCSTPGFPLCPSLSPGAYSNSMSIESVVPSNHLILCRHLLLPSRSFPLSHFFTSGGQSIAVSASLLLLSMNIQDRFPLVLTSLISLLSKGLPRVFSNVAFWKHQFFGVQPSFCF